MKLSTLYYSGTTLVATLLASNVMAAPIAESSLFIQSPVSGAVYSSGESITIDWTTQENVLLNISAIAIGSSDKSSIATIVAHDVNSTTGRVFWSAPSNVLSENELYMIEISYDSQIISSGQFTIKKASPSSNQPKTDALVDPMSGATASASITILGQGEGSVKAAQHANANGAVRVGSSMASGVTVLLFAIFFI